MSEHAEYLRDVKSKLSLSQAIERPWENISYKENIEQIAILSCHENKPIKAETNFHGKYVLIPAKSNIVDTELSFVEQRDELKSATDEKLLNDWKEICEDQKQSVVGDHLEMLGIAVSKEMFSRNSELREQIDLPQTLRLYNVLKQSRNQENKTLLPEIEKDLQTKAWHYFASEIESGENPKKFRSTPYSVSCVDELKDFMVNKMHAPEDVITPKLENIETSMMSAIYAGTLRRELTPNAKNVVYNTALKHPEHGSSRRIIGNINISNGGSSRVG